MNCDWSILSELFFGLVNLANEIDETFASFGNALLRPIGEMKLSYSSWLAILKNIWIKLMKFQSIQTSCNNVVRNSDIQTTEQFIHYF